jgi:valyl-tRNA synthetase
MTEPPPVPPNALERTWDRAWEAAGVYRFRPSAETYAIDTPPPSVVGRVPRLTHVVTYTQVDCLARYERMSGREPFFPVGWDDHDAATERRVAERYGVRCAGPSGIGAADGDRAVDRPAFLRLAAQVTADDARPFEELWRMLGISVDWSTRYTMLGERARRVAQLVFLDEFAGGRVRRTTTPPGRPGAGVAMWRLRTGWDEPELREGLQAAAEAIRFLPPYMADRLADVLRTRTGDLTISERRPFGVPVPIWYPVDDAGAVDPTRPITPAVHDLPVDPSVDTPAGYRPEQRGARGGFVADPDVLCPDATASLTPLIATGWQHDPELFGQVYPMAVRPQGHYIIQSWLFTSLLRGYFADGRAPWRSVLLSGWLLPGLANGAAEDAAVASPLSLVRRFGGDGVRYWAASRQPGRDQVADVGRMRRGRRLADALVELGRAAARAGPRTDGPAELTDRAVPAAVRDAAARSTQHLGDGRYDRALAEADRLIGTLRRSLPPPAPAVDVMARLFAPFLPFAAEECWSTIQSGSVHRAKWPLA